MLFLLGWLCGCAIGIGMGYYFRKCEEKHNSISEKLSQAKNELELLRKKLEKT